MIGNAVKRFHEKVCITNPKKSFASRLFPYDLSKRPYTMSHLPSSTSLGSAASDGGMHIHAGSTNRFIEMATILFHIPAASNVVLRVYDQSGQTVHQRDEQFEPGDNHFLLHRSDLPESGLYLYRVETAFGAGIRKIMLY